MFKQVLSFFHDGMLASYTGLLGLQIPLPAFLPAAAMEKRVAPATDSWVDFSVCFLTAVFKTSFLPSLLSASLTSWKSQIPRTFQDRPWFSFPNVYCLL